MDEFSLYCIVDGDAFTMPLARDEYVLDVTTELHKNHQVFYLIFCRYFNPFLTLILHIVRTKTEEVNPFSHYPQF